MTLPTIPPPPFRPIPDPPPRPPPPPPPLPGPQHGHQPDRRCPERRRPERHRPERRPANRRPPDRPRPVDQPPAGRRPPAERPTVESPTVESPSLQCPAPDRSPAPRWRHPATDLPHPGDPAGRDDAPETYCGGRRRRKGGRRGHRRDRHSSRRRRFRQRQRRRWRRGEPRRRKRRHDRPGGGAGNPGSPPRPTPEPTPDNGGFTLIDLLLTLAVLGIIALVTVPNLIRSTDRMRLRVAGSEASRIFTVARSHAALHSTHVGVKFHPGKGDEPTTWSLHRDGDGDGVRSADIRRGDDPPVPGPGGGDHRLARFGPVRLGFPPGPLPRDPGGRKLNRRHDPIRFNRSDIASFGPLGTATPGSLYLTDGRHLAAVRITNRTGRVRVLIYDAERGEWR